MREDTKGLRQIGPGRWLIQLRRGGNTRTKRVKGSERVALQLLAQLKTELDTEVARDEAAKTLGMTPKEAQEALAPLTFEQFLAEVYTPWADANLYPSTRRSRESTLWHLGRFFGAVPLAEVTPALVDEFKAQRLAEGVVYRDDRAQNHRKPRPLSKSGLAEQLKVLRAVLSFAYKRGHLDKLPHIEMPRDKRGEPGAAKPVRYFTLDERQRLLRWANPQLADVLRVALLTGVRPGELFHLRARSVDLKRGVLTVEEQLCPACPHGRWIPKVGSWRQLEIHADLKPVLRRLIMDRHPDALLIDNRHGSPFCSLKGSGGSFAKLLKRTGLARQGLSFYSLRHTFAADLASAGHSLEKIGKLLGHTDPRSTKVYAHLMPEALSGVVHAAQLPADPWVAPVVSLVPVATATP